MSGHGEREHALLSASGAHRWIKCPPSALLEAEYPESTSIHAEKGTHAHEIAELKLKYYILESIPLGEYSKKMKEYRASELYEDDMEENTDAYVSYVQSIRNALGEGAIVFQEQRVDLEDVTQGFGTVDCTLIAGEELHIVDYKNGRKFVGVDNNDQLLLYAYGMYGFASQLFNIKEIYMHIVQPKVDNLASFSVTVEELLTYIDGVKKVAQKALKGEGEFCAGDHCFYCKVKDCKAKAQRELGNVAEMFKDVIQENKNPDTLTEEELAVCMKTWETAKKWYESVEQYLLGKAEAGATFKHFDIVLGRSSSGIDDTEVYNMCKDMEALGYDKWDFLETKKKALGAMKKVVKGNKDAEETLEKYVKKKPGNPKVKVLDEAKRDITEIFDIREEK